MYYSSILDVYLVTDPDDVYIATQNCIEPNTAIITHDNISNDCCIRSKETVVPELWIYPVYMHYYSHNEIALSIHVDIRDIAHFDSIRHANSEIQKTLRSLSPKTLA